MEQSPRPDVTNREKVLIAKAYGHGAIAFARRLADESSPAETIKADWLRGRCEAPEIQIPEGLAQQIVSEEAHESWRLDFCECGHTREAHFNYSGMAPDIGGCARCVCERFREAAP